MKIAFDLRRIQNPGIGRYMRCLTEAVLAQGCDHEYLLILPPGDPKPAGSGVPNVECIESDLPYYSIREQFELPRILKRHGADVLHSPHFNVPLRRVCPTVATIHDVIYLACPGDLPSRAGRLYYSAMMRAAVRVADRILTDSEWSRIDIIHHIGCVPEKIEVVYPAVPAGFAAVKDVQQVNGVLSRLGIDSDYILYTGIYKPRKNHAALLHAFCRLLGNGIRAKLVIAGPLDGGEIILRQLTSTLGIENHVVFAGFVSDHDLPALYTGARIYACPSLYEGFGFTILEAMACCVPVVCSRETSLPEVAGDAALFADPRNIDEFAGALEQAFNNESLRHQLIARGLANVKRFSWARAASHALSTYKQVCGSELEKAVCA